MDSPWTAEGRLGQDRLGQVSSGQISIGQFSLDKERKVEESIGTDTTVNNRILTDEQLIQSVYIKELKDKNANNIIECVSYLKFLPIELIRIALEKTAQQSKPEWNYTKEILNNWISKNIKSLSDLEQLNNHHKSSNKELSQNVTTNIGGFRRKGDEILNGL